MPIDRNIWRNSLGRWHSPRWPCPSCASGALRLKRDTLHFDHTAASRHRLNDDHPVEWEAEYVFSALLECNRCSETISCCGIGGNEPIDALDEEGNSYTDSRLYFDLRYFSMPMAIFRIPANCPRHVKEQIRKSFSVFFCDLGAAANHVRKCIEEILSHAGVQPRDANGRFIQLESRINSFEDIDPDNAERASALRWIGNFGSHPEPLTKDDLFDAYDILEVLVEDLYVGHHRSVRQMVEQINEARGPRR